MSTVPSNHRRSGIYRVLISCSKKHKCQVKTIVCRRKGKYDYKLSPSPLHHIKHDKSFKIYSKVRTFLQKFLTNRNNRCQRRNLSDVVCPKLNNYPMAPLGNFNNLIYIRLLPKVGLRIDQLPVYFNLKRI